MVTKKKVALDTTPAFSLHGGFTNIKPNKKWLDVKGLKYMLSARSRENKFAYGLEQHNKLLEFCEKCLKDRHNETIVMVVAEANNEKGVAYQCLFECNGSPESFILDSSFFRNFDLPLKIPKASASIPAHA